MKTNIDNSFINSALGGMLKAIPLISFHSIIDEDIACLKYAILDIGVNPSFDLDSIKSKTFYNIIYDLYMRKYKNPIYYIKSNNANIELLDRVYDELLTDIEDKVLKRAITTEMYSVLLEFKQSSDIIPNILYYTEAQKVLLQSIDKLSGINLVNIEEAKINPNQWSQFYFKYTTEFEPFEKLKDKTFYFSSCGLNLNEDNSDINIEKDRLVSAIKNRNKISLYDIYRTDIIGRN